MIPLKQLRTEMREVSEKTTTEPLPRIAIQNPWAEYQVMPATVETTAGYIYIPMQEAIISPANLKRLLDALDAAERAFSHIAATCQCEESYELCDCSTSMKRAARAALKALEDGV